MALVGATTWTMYLSRRRGTMHSLERWRALAARLGYPKHATKIARSRPLRLVCHSFTSSIYLPILAKRRNIRSLSDMCTNRSPGRIVPQGESYNFIGPLRGDSFQQGVVASPLKLLPTWVTSIFYLVGIESEHVREEFLRLISLLLRALLGDGEINLGWTFLRDLWWEVRVSSRAIFSSFRIGVMIFTSNRNWFW